ncbi:MAG TPA: SAM-dependent methyltransferase [Rugosimonospora sp.]|nr:SAM-dependent methyltransferase [Rugosimonospora sp.]
MQRPGWVPEGVDVTVPNAARVYDAALGGSHNFQVDREFVDQAEQMWPGVSVLAHVNRSYLGRAVRWLAGAGVRQFLDIGSGIPTLGNVHEVAQAGASDARVMYVDIDPVAVAHSQELLAGNPLAGVIEGDLRDPQAILSHPRVTGLLDFAQPVAVLLIAVLHFLPDADDPAGIVASLRDGLVSGSYLALSHGTRPAGMQQRQDDVLKLYDRTPTSVHLRGPDQIRQILAGWSLVPPGIVPVTDWYPDPDEEEESPRPEILAAVAHT